MHEDEAFVRTVFGNGAFFTAGSGKLLGKALDYISGCIFNAFRKMKSRTGCLE